MSAAPVAATVLAALCFSAAAVLQQRGALRVPAADHLDPWLLLQLARQPPFAAGLVLDAAGFGLSTWALRALPLFVVQAGAAASLAVTAVLSARTLGERLTPTARAAVAVTGAGVLLLALSAGEDAASVPALLAPTLLAGVPALVALAVAVLAVATRRGRTGGTGVALGVLAGVAFAGFAVSGRVAALDDPSTAASDPAAWALIGYLLVGLTLYGASLQRGSVTVVTASYVALEVLVPTAVGVLVLGDAPRPGTTAAAAAGFALVIVGVVALARVDGTTPSSAGRPWRRRREVGHRPRPGLL